jgi:hypothetical protein
MASIAMKAPLDPAARDQGTVKLGSLQASPVAEPQAGADEILQGIAHRQSIDCSRLVSSKSSTNEPVSSGQHPVHPVYLETQVSCPPHGTGRRRPRRRSEIFPINDHR